MCEWKIRARVDPEIKVIKKSFNSRKYQNKIAPENENNTFYRSQPSIVCELNFPICNFYYQKNNTEKIFILQSRKQTHTSNRKNTINCWPFEGTRAKLNYNNIRNSMWGYFHSSYFAFLFLPHCMFIVGRFILPKHFSLQTQWLREKNVIFLWYVNARKCKLPKILLLASALLFFIAGWGKMYIFCVLWG